jgi:lysozyme
MISDKGIQFIEDREGVRLVAYQDVKGIWTIGVGHTGPEVKKGLIWTTEQVSQALQDDLKEVQECIYKNIKYPISQNQYDALCSFIFNVGIDAFAKSTILKKINAGDLAGAGNEFDRWNIPQQIIGRRMKEKALFLTM